MPAMITDAKKQERTSIQAYQPLGAMLLVGALAAWALNSDDWMRLFMGQVFVLFAMFKLFDMGGFANGFQMYDFIAKRLRPYAYLYPVLELLLGLAFLAGYLPEWVLAATMVLMFFTAAGVLRALKNGMDIYCPCMGTVLKVPLSTVSLVENLAMGAMAGWMLFS